LFKYLKSLLNSGKYYFFCDILERSISFIVFLVFAKALSTSVYGQIVTLFAVTSIIATLFDFGLPVYIQRESARSNNLNTVYNQILLLKLLSLIVYLIISVAVVNIFMPSINHYFALIIICITFIVNTGNSLKFIFYGRDNSKQVFYSSGTAKIILLAAIGGTYVFYPNVYIFLLGYLFANVFLTIRLLYSLKVYHLNIIPVFSGIKYLKTIFISIIPLGFASIFNILYDRIDIILLNFFLDYHIVAQYFVAYTIYKLSVIALSIFIYPALNRFSRESNNSSVLLFLLKKLSTIILFCSILLSILYYFVIPKLVIFTFGTKYMEASKLIAYLGIAITFISLNNLTGVFLNAVGKFKEVMIATLIGLIINILANVLAIPTFKAIGAVFASILTEFLILTIETVFIYYYFINKKKIIGT